MTTKMMTEDPWEGGGERGADTGGSARIEEIVRFLFRRKAVILAAIAVATGVAIVGSYVAPPVYRCTTSLMVRRDRPPSLTQLTAPSWSIDLEEVIQTEIGILRSHSVLTEVVNQLRLDEPKTAPDFFDRLGAVVTKLVAATGLTLKVSPREQAIDWVRRRVKIKPIARSDIITVSMTADDPKLAHAVLQVLSHAYLDKHAEVYHNAGLHKFYEEQVQISKGVVERLHAVEDSLMNLFSVLSVAEERGYLLSEKNHLEQKIQSTALILDQMWGGARFLRQSANDSSAVGFVPLSMTGDFRALQTMQNQLMDLEKQRIEMMQRYQHDDRKTAALSAKIREHKLNLADGLDAAGRQLEEQKKELIARRDELTHTLVDFKSKETRLTEVSLAIEVAEKNYRRYQERLENSRLDAIGQRQMVNVSVVDEPELPSHPLRSRLFVIQLAAALSLFLGIGVAFLAEVLDPSIHTPIALNQKLRLPALAVIPAAESHGKVQENR